MSNPPEKAAMGKLSREQIERFWSYSLPDGFGCRVWGGAVTSNGYGSFWANGKTHRAHRLAYLLCRGEIPEGKQLDHLCRNRLCVEPDHLEAVTQYENIRRGIGAPALNARKTHCPKGHPYTEENTYRKSSGGRECWICRRINSRKYDQNYAEKRKARRQSLPPAPGAGKGET